MAHTDETSALRFAVLGPVRAWRGEESLPVGTPQQRAMLAALLLRGGRTATAQELVDGIWGEEPPPRAVSALRTYASRLRRTLGADALVSEAGGYAIRAHGTEVDVATAEKLASSAESAATAGDFAQARELYAGAVAQFTGEPLAGVPGPYADWHRDRLEELRLSLLEHRIELDLDAAKHAEAVSELTALTAGHPLRERFRELLMLALYRSGRQAEALAVYADTRRLLQDELGVDPRPELSDLQQRILQADEELAAPKAEPLAGDAPFRVVRPAQLPATVSDFTGRVGVVEELGKELANAPDTVMAVSSVSGIGGVGKTTLAVHVAHAARESFPDGQLYADLQGSGPSPAEPAAVLGAFLRALGTPDADIPEPVDERAALYRSVLAGRRILTLLDNARDAAQIRPLLPGTEGCAALITSRTRMTDLAGAHHVDLDVMAPDEALLLFTRIVGAERVTPERDAAMDVVAACGFLPLAIRIAASRLAARRTWTVSVLARKLSDEHRRLDELRVGDLAVKATFELGYGQLEPEQARAFRLLGLADGPDISVTSAAAIVDRTAEKAEALLEDLVDASLVESAAPGRYRFHDLVRLFARDCAEREEPASEREAALSRLLDFYLATAARVYELDRPGDTLTSHLAPVAYQGLHFADRHSAQDWRLAEADCLMATARQLSGEGTLARAVDLLMVTVDLAESGTYSYQFAQIAGHLLVAARHLGDSRSEGRAHDVLAASHIDSGRFEQADKHAAAAMGLARASGDPVICGHAASDRGIIADLQGRSADAAVYLEDALAAYRADGNLSGEASALSNLSRMHSDAGRPALAVDLAEQALAIHHKLGPSFRMANCMYALGIILTGAGRPDHALAQLDAALKLFRENRMHLWYGMTQFRMAEAHLAAEQPTQAATLAEQALTRLHGIGGDWHRAQVLTALGRSLQQIGQQGRAQACWSEAAVLHEKTNSPEAADVRALLEPATTA
ncbi:BTAD domain-containing putative transcriptional regulator [Streptomyces sp. WMMC500]|uniref:AfsR/SARP family transcriptional regulator n=1 Tax=Streptomyces sp. WMMC500 TaxID=3015154 RepID=UPI00248B0EE2|nr:BTAD domain-containing putative transcriptional regulator [Streptomyces sp. WMMC500]WBB58679.1 BTAD domain-containing putative transcriptional regulator [Streptomyces sp. WMMC500]